MTDATHLEVAGIDDLRRAPRKLSDRIDVNAGRRSLSEAFVRTLVIEREAKAVESPLLTRPRLLRRSCRFRFEGPVHPLVSPVVGRTTGTRLANIDAQPQPPYRQTRQACEPLRCAERLTIVGDDHLWHAVLSKDA